jgi:hypothetical protein
VEDGSDGTCNREESRRIISGWRWIYTRIPCVMFASANGRRVKIRFSRYNLPPSTRREAGCRAELIPAGKVLETPFIY